MQLLIVSEFSSIFFPLSFVTHADKGLLMKYEEVLGREVYSCKFD